MKIPVHSLALLWVVLGLLTFPGCGEKPSGNVVAERIEYPVFIKSPYGEQNGCYWKENLETSKRQEFVKTLFEWAYGGKIKAFDYVTAIGNTCDTVTMTRPNPPYDEYDTVIKSKLDLNLIHKVKMLEEWKLDPDNYTVVKKLLGIAPTLTIYADSNEVKGYKPLFWIYFDQEYIKKLSEQNLNP
jgi:hypothetical protein